MAASLFAAAETGDVTTLERLFQDPSLREQVRTLETSIATRGRIISIPTNAWLYRVPHDPYHHFFRVAVMQAQYEVVAWLYKSPTTLSLMPHTLQYFLEDAAATAIYQRDACLLELLLTVPRNAAYPNQSQLAFLSSLLQAAMQSGPRGNCVFLSLLVSHGVDCDGLLPLQGSPLCSAAAELYAIDAINALYEHGATTVGDDDALRRATENDHTLVVARLVALGVDPRAKDDALSTPLHFAAGYRDFCTTTIALLESAAVDMDARNENGATALTHAAMEYCLEDEDADHESEGESRFHIIRALLDHGANPDLCAPAGDTEWGYELAPLHWAVKKPSVRLARLLLQHGANVHVRTTESEQTPAHLLCDHETFGDASLALLDLLVAYGADLDIKDAWGWTTMALLRETPVASEWVHKRDSTT